MLNRRAVAATSSSGNRGTTPSLVRSEMTSPSSREAASLVMVESLVKGDSQQHQQQQQQPPSTQQRRTTTTTATSSSSKHPPGAAMQVTSLSLLDGQEEDLNKNASSTNNNNNASDNIMTPLSLEESKHVRKMKHWKESPFAIGLTEPSWSDEFRQGSDALAACCRPEIEPEGAGCLCCSGLVCAMLGAGRVGNMAVLRQTQEWVEEVQEDDEDNDDDDDNDGNKGEDGDDYDDDDDDEDANHKYDGDEETGSNKKKKKKTKKMVIRRFTRPRLDIVVGPYWPMLCCVTYPLIFGVSLWTLVGAILPGKQYILVVLAWMACTIGLISALALTAFRDPGILHRYNRPPPQEENQWRWSDLALTYRPRGAVFDPDTAVVVEEFDHTCPWTGTAIGKKNMTAFQAFVGLVFVCLIFDIILLTGALN